MMLVEIAASVAAALSKIEIPVHVVAIEDTDRLFPPRLQHEIVDLNPNRRTPSRD
jgi:homoserine acetyltransferase